MGQYKAFWLTMDHIFSSDKSDSHTAIAREHGLHEDGPHGPNGLKVELIPTTSLPDISTWKYHVDQDIMPEWLRGDEEERTRRAARASFKGTDLRRLHGSGGLDLRSLTTLPSDARLSVTGNLDLNSLTKMQAGAEIKVSDGDVWLNGLTKLPANVKIRVSGGDLYLAELTELPAVARISVSNGDIWLDSLTQQPHPGISARKIHWKQGFL
jgi:hypothetical protein